jgi:HicB family
MDLQRYVENIQHQLAVTAEAGGDDARALAERLTAPLEAAIRFALQDALVAAAEEITCELAPGSVELRLRGRDPEFVVTAPPVDASLEDLSEGDRDRAPDGWPGAATDLPSLASGDADDGAMSRINLRMPDHLKARIEHAARSEGISVNAWLVRAATAAVARGNVDRPPERRSPQRAQRYTGWAR